MSPIKAAIGVGADRDATDAENSAGGRSPDQPADYQRQITTTSPGGFWRTRSIPVPSTRRVRAAQRSIEALEQHRQRTPDTPEPPPPDPLDDLTGSFSLPELL